MSDPFIQVDIPPVVAVLGASPDKWREPILTALREINARSGNRYPAEKVFEHLMAWKLQAGSLTDVWLFFDEARIQQGENPQACMVGFLTIDMGSDDIGQPVAILSRAWTKPGFGAALWRMGKPAIWNWAKERGCVRIQFQTERDSAFARWMEADGFQRKETIFEVEVPAEGAVTV